MKVDWVNVHFIVYPDDSNELIDAVPKPDDNSGGPQKQENSSISPNGNIQVKQETQPLPQPVIKSEHQSIPPSATQEPVASAVETLVNHIPPATPKSEDPTALVHVNGATPSVEARRLSDVPLTEIKKVEEKKPFDLIAFANKRMKILEQRRLEKEQLLKERLKSEEATLGKNLGFYTPHRHFPQNFNETLNEYYDERVQEIEKKLVTQQRKRVKYLKKQDEKRKKLAEEEAKKHEHLTTELDFGFGGDEDEEDIDMDDFQFDDDDENPDNKSQQVGSVGSKTVPTNSGGSISVKVSPQKVVSDTVASNNHEASTVPTFKEEERSVDLIFKEEEDRNTSLVFKEAEHATSQVLQAAQQISHVQENKSSVYGTSEKGIEDKVESKLATVSDSNITVIPTQETLVDDDDEEDIPDELFDSD
ncbi:unnamed protein product [Ambrosiozyma monospora]|uniref:Unnamed protein product n=1 Tax=Ambrosiozyma monospora TaxID=43982 RepID=A0A9W7DIM7_AMBMO|nr:unnamed protein product [Ambrosiozyma monospora]